jgi:hypothetical protein
MRIRVSRFQNIRLIIGTLLVAGVIAGGIFFILSTFFSSNPLPKLVQSDLTFSPLVIPLGSSTTTSNYALSRSEDNAQLLTFTIKRDGATINVTEYIQPVEFTDIPEYKDVFLSNVVQQYETVPTASGTIYLGRLSKQSDQQIAVMIEKGLIIFMQPTKELTSDEWRGVGDQLILQKVVN